MPSKSPRPSSGRKSPYPKSGHTKCAARRAQLKERILKLEHDVDTLKETVRKLIATRLADKVAPTGKQTKLGEFSD